MRNDSTGIVRATATEANGRFLVARLPVGVYAIEVSAPGFSTARRNGLQLAGGKTADLAIALTIAAFSEEVTVTHELPEAAKAAPS